MCYRCATNPSIHHHRRHVAAVSSSLSHHGVAFMSVTVLSLPSWCRLRRCIVTVLLSPLCHCGAFPVALSRFHRPRHSVTFVVALLWFRCRHHGVTFAFVMVSLLPLRCCLHVGHSFVFAIAVLPSSSHRHGVIVTVTSLWCLRCHIVVVSLSPSLSHCHHFVIAIVVSPSHLS